MHQMCKKIILYLALFLFAITIVGCSGNVQDNNNEKLPQRNVQEQETEKEKDPIKEQIKQMTLDEKIGQMVTIGLEGYELDDNTRTMIEEYHVGGFILFGKNIENSQQLLNLT